MSFQCSVQYTNYLSPITFMKWKRVSNLSASSNLPFQPFDVCWVTLEDRVHNAAWTPLHSHQSESENSSDWHFPPPLSLFFILCEKVQQTLKGRAFVSQRMTTRVWISAGHSGLKTGAHARQWGCVGCGRMRRRGGGGAEQLQAANTAGSRNINIYILLLLWCHEHRHCPAHPSINLIIKKNEKRYLPHSDSQCGVTV